MKKFKITPEIRERLMKYFEINSDTLDVILDCEKELPKPKPKEIPWSTGVEFINAMIRGIQKDGDAQVTGVKLYDRCDPCGWNLEITFDGLLSWADIRAIGQVFGDNSAYINGNHYDVVIKI